MRALVVVAGLCGAVLLAACDDQAASLETPAAQASGGQGAAVHASPVPKASAADPAIKEGQKANPSFDVGQTVHITSAGIQPLSLVSSCCTPIVFRNESSNPVTIIFDVSKATSGPLAPGRTWSWTPPNPESVIYHLGTNLNQSGQIQIESANW